MHHHHPKKSLHVHHDTKGRKIAWVPEIIKEKLPSSELWRDKDRTKPNLSVLKSHLFGEGKLELDDAIRIMQLTEKLLGDEPNLLTLDAPLTICGDIHGQFYDLIKLFEIAGTPDKVNFLFLGDYVDRGMFGCEVVLYLWSWKLNYPNKIHFLRGNHECRHLTEYFNFKKEALYKYGLSFYNAVMRTFDCLPLAAVMDDKFFCVHGGLSPELETLDDIKKIDRKQEVPCKGLFCDLLWADPLESYDQGDEGGYSFEDYFQKNAARGCSYSFTYAAVCKFLDNNNLLAVFRAHEVQYQGYRMYKERECEDGQFPSMITIFSAPNYCDDHGNKGAVLEYGLNDLLNIKQFKAVEHPYWLPSFANVFTWSLPFVQEKICEIILTLSLLDLKEFEKDVKKMTKKGELTEELSKELEQTKEVIQNKVNVLGKLALILGKIRTENENMIKIKALREMEQIPEGVKTEGPITVKATQEFFQESIKAHQTDEMMPKPETPEQQDSSSLPSSDTQNTDK